jgi:hypothetical protein
MKSLTPILPLLALLGAATTSLVGCGADTSNGTANGGTSANAGKSSTSGAAGSGAGGVGSSSSGGTAADEGGAAGVGGTWASGGGAAAGAAAAGGAAAGGAAAGGAAAGGAAAGGAGDGGATGVGGTPFTDRCGGCNYNGIAPQICIYQAGGPGPGRFVCATQNPCGAAGECVCIVGQGACSPTVTLEAGGPYCVCDNGLD